MAIGLTTVSFAASETVHRHSHDARVRPPLIGSRVLQKSSSRLERTRSWRIGLCLKIWHGHEAQARSLLIGRYVFLSSRISCVVGSSERDYCAVLMEWP